MSPGNSIRFKTSRKMKGRPAGVDQDPGTPSREKVKNSI